MPYLCCVPHNSNLRYYILKYPTSYVNVFHTVTSHRIYQRASKRYSLFELIAKISCTYIVQNNVLLWKYFNSFLCCTYGILAHISLKACWGVMSNNTSRWLLRLINLPWVQKSDNWPRLLFQMFNSGIEVGNTRTQHYAIFLTSPHPAPTLLQIAETGNKMMRNSHYIMKLGE